MDESRAAQAFEEEIAAVLSGLPTPVHHRDRGGLDRSIQIAKELRGLAVDWKRLVSPALKQQVASIVKQARDGVQHRAASGRAVRRDVFRVGVALTAAATLIILAVPAARQGVARQLYRVLDVVAVGPATEVVRPDASTPGEISSTLRQFDRQLASGSRWHLSTPYGGFGGGVPPGASPALQRVDRLDLLRSMTPMTIQVPTSAYRGAFPAVNHALVAPDGLVLVFLGAEDRELLIVQAPVGDGRGMSYSRTVAGTDKQGRLVQQSPELRTEEFLLREQSVTWDPDTTELIPNSSALRWERDGITYSLMGRRLTREEAVQLFLSLRPAEKSRLQ